jgi:hypothetical protein
MIGGELGVDSAWRHLAEKSAQQRVVAGAGLMCTGDDCIDDPESGASADRTVPGAPTPTR